MGLNSLKVPSILKQICLLNMALVILSECFIFNVQNLHILPGTIKETRHHTVYYVKYLNYQYLSVFRHAEDYEAVFVFHGILGEKPKSLYIRAKGSYDGKHEALLNI